MANTDTLHHRNTPARAGLRSVRRGEDLGRPEIGMHLSDAPVTQWSYPQSAALFLVESVLLAVAHLLSAAGFVGALRLQARAAAAGPVGRVFGRRWLDWPAWPPQRSPAVVAGGERLSNRHSSQHRLRHHLPGLRGRRDRGWPRHRASGCARPVEVGACLATGIVIIVLVGPREHLWEACSGRQRC